ncbi:MAG: BlaI/MecI/CopY family transcriptional regulator [Agathobacter sp.]|nr:BlaI/MecI/CopY family transcriptional regulator [Agathobacter sp.]
MREQLLGREISGCETLIMKIVWDSKEDISTPDLIEALRVRFGKDYARTTVVTFLQRLAKKGFVKIYRKGRVAYVHALKSEKEYTTKFLNEAEDFWFEGDSSNLMAALCDTKKLSKEEIGRIRELLNGLDD